jgi:hypothetical protein
MLVNPVSHVEAPLYPSAEVADAGELLSKNVPQRWRSNRLAGVLAVTLAASFAGGCGSQADSSRTPPPSRWARPSLSYAEASAWVRSIYQTPQPPRLMGKIAVPQPPVNEERVMPNRPDNLQ